ncbi:MULTISPECIES: hypothetical protein [Staphylococcus]|uniref:hypothetical protein n=1 Tax=Staphylococcus TaxID=1279 RepID=UPI00026C1E3C|nr:MULTISPECIES: hypothetical protein [Staphylococcus]MDU2710155.1 hypothetical protein [Finegoldia magna]EJD86749.1 hypothetical protein HMPREF9990_11747 [Staphylococcus epidermidis NIHLM061]MCD8926031.1 hypothetical protein [Staphylococcus epidermidis]MCH9581861.1 hypothetical protein [Staphylococcus epidermidis]MCN0157308.1 hypothetical protein [Staphylococcus epidermidis]
MSQIDKWNNKFNALPRLARSQSKFGYVDTVKTLFHKICSKERQEAIVNIEVSNTKHPLKHYIEILLRYQFIKIDYKNNYYITKNLTNFEKKILEKI